MKNFHLVMPMGGKGQRFFNDGYVAPKPLIEIHDRPFFYWSTMSILKYNPDCDVTFVVLREHIEKFDIKNRILSYFPQARVLTPAVMGLFLLTASGVLDLLFGFSGASALTGSGETVTVFVTAQGSQLFSGREHLVVGLLSLLSAASLLPAVPACRIRPEGGARKPFQSPLLLVPVCCLVVRLVLTYRVVSVDPSLTDYYTELLAVVFLALAFYRLSSFAFRAGRSIALSLSTKLLN